MTLKLAHDANKVSELQVYNFQDIAGCARRFADQLEAGEQGEPIRLLVIAHMPDGIALCIWGESASHYEQMGVIEAAKQRVYETIFEID